MSHDQVAGSVVVVTGALSGIGEAARIRNHAMSAKPQPLDFVARTAAASAAMTASQRVEMALTHRPGSELPVRVVEALIGRGVPTGALTVVHPSTRDECETPAVPAAAERLHDRRTR
jgi:hypothetical protein